MREIKFRGQRKDNLGWIYGGLLYADNRYFIVKSIGIRDDRYSCDTHINQEVISNTVGQYIGLKDKNDKKIFEDDIVKCDGFEPKNYLVEFIEGGYCLTNNTVDIMPIDINMLYPSIGCQLEIIGNIHQDSAKDI